MAIKPLFAFLLMLFMQSCTQGALYTHTTEPLTTNFQSTPSNTKLNSATGSTKHIHFQLQAKWDSNGIGEIAKLHGITDIYYADLETINFLSGIWEQQYVRVYGK